MVVLVFVTELSCICNGIVLYLLRNCLVYVTELSCICYGIVLYLLRNCLVVSVWQVRVISFNFARLRTPGVSKVVLVMLPYIIFPNFISYIIFHVLE